MMKRNLLAALYFIAFNTFAQQITTGSLLREMTDLSRLTEFPNPSYKTVQYSSYDRRSIRPDEKNWFANSDGFGSEPIPGFEKILSTPDKNGVGRYLICDVTGPGAIVRMWTARINGDLTVYLDQSRTPLYQGSAVDFIKHTYQVLGAKDNDDFSGTFTQYDAGYFSIPFAKRCRIEWTGKLTDLHFYHIQIRLFDTEAKVVTFKPGDVQKFAEEINKAILKLKNPDQVANPAGAKDSFAEKIIRKDFKEIYSKSGSKAISEFRLKIEAEDIFAALRQSVLNIYFDDRSSSRRWSIFCSV